MLDKVKIGVICSYDYFYTDLCDAVETAYDVTYLDTKATFSIKTENREYIHYNLNDIDNEVDFSILDAVLILFNPREFISDEVEETLKQVKEAGVEFTFFYCNVKPEKISEDLIEETKCFITDFLKYEIEFPIFINPIIYGYLSDAIFGFESTTNSIRKLIKEYDDKLYKGLPFVFHSEGARKAPTPNNFLVTGIVNQGILSINDRIEVIKNNKQYKGKITKIWAANLFKIKKNQKARIFIEGIDDVNILDSGAILHSENSITMHKKFNAKIYILTKDDGAWNNNNIKPSQTYTFSINESEYTGKTIYGEGEKVFYPAYSYHPGETDVISIELNESVFIYMNQSIALYDEDDDLVAHGNVVEILD